LCWPDLFFTTGDVHKPGTYHVNTGLTLRQAIFEVAGNVAFWCRRAWYFRVLDSCTAEVSIVRPDSQGNLDFVSAEVTDWDHTGSEAVRAGDLISVQVFVHHLWPD